MRVGRTLAPGHPDRACDIIAETIVDEYLRRDPAASLRVHVTGGKGAMFVTGAVSSKADFDVGSIVSRTAASLGARKPVEPFVALEPVPGVALLEATRTARPISVMGYATRETIERIPSPVLLSRRLTKALEDKRQHDPEWFWLEPSFEVSVIERPELTPIVFMNCGHGQTDLTEAREQIRSVLESVAEGADIRINTSGALSASGLDDDCGASGMQDDPYGSAVAFASSPAGLDPSNPRKFGSWLSRELAKRALERSDARAVMVQAVYQAGDGAPSHLRVRDERGRDLLQAGDKESLRFAALYSRLEPGLNVDAMRWGFAGEAGLPWE
jgi:S-adenosylmethionine synthetase